MLVTLKTKSSGIIRRDVKSNSVSTFCSVIRSTKEKFDPKSNVLNSKSI